MCCWKQVSKFKAIFHVHIQICQKVKGACSSFFKNISTAWILHDVCPKICFLPNLGGGGNCPPPSTPSPVPMFLAKLLSHILAFLITLLLYHSLFYIYRLGRWQVALKVLSLLTGAAGHITAWHRCCCFHTGMFRMHCSDAPLYHAKSDVKEPLAVLCLSVCCMSQKPCVQTSPQFSVHVACGCSSVDSGIVVCYK